MARTNFTGLTADSTIAFRFNEYGRAFNTCANVGKVWNPLSELDSLGRVNPYQDPSRGNIDDIVADANGAITNSIQKEVLQNLSGHDSIIGRSVTVFQKNDDGTLPSQPIGCCVIGYDAQPAASAVAPTHHHHSSYQQPSYGHGSYGHGSYGNYGRSYSAPRYGSYGQYGSNHKFW